MRKLIIPAGLALVALGLLASGITWAARDVGEPSGGLSIPVDLNEQEDICGHDPFIFGSADHNMKLNVIIDGSFISISGPSPWVNVTGDLSPTGAFTATGTGQVGPNPAASVVFDGSLEGDVLTGEYVMGAGPNDLPPCGVPPTHHPAVYEVKPKPVTPTPTPAEKLYSIIVLKLNNANNNPLAGFQFNLFLGLNCQGTAVLTRTTGDRGLADFTGLEPGSYSIREKAEAGWNVVGEACQNVQVPQGGVAGLPACPIVPDAEFPQPGCDSFVSGARVIVRINDTGAEFPVTLNGPTLIARLNKPTKSGGFDRVETEIVGMELAGASPLGDITVRESEDRESRGAIVEQVNTGAGKMNFPANSFFDVFFDVTIPDLGVTLHNEEPFRVECKIEEIPPILCFYQPPIADPIDLLNSSGDKVAKIIHGLHIPLPPNETLVVFTNQAKGTPTVTATQTPTRTPTPDGQPTPTQTRTPTPSANPTPNGFCEKAEQDVGFQGETWDSHWKCTPDPPSFRFDRIDMFVGTATQDPRKLDTANPPLFQCQSTGQIVTGSFKGTKKNVNPGTSLPHHEVWSADFDGKCQDGADIYLQTTDPANDAVIDAVAFTNSSGQPTPPPTPTRTPTRTPTPAAPGSGDVNKNGILNAIDATLTLQGIAGLIAILNPDNADTNQDGNVNSVDVTLMLQRIADLIPTLPVGGPVGVLRILW